MRSIIAKITDLAEKPELVEVFPNQTDVHGGANVRICIYKLLFWLQYWAGSKCKSRLELSRAEWAQTMRRLVQESDLREVFKVVDDQVDFADSVLDVDRIEIADFVRTNFKPNVRT